MKTIILTLIRAYQYILTPLFVGIGLKPFPTCRFYPSCSDYACQAIARHGVFRGSWMSLKRILRCHPFNPGGIDPVP
ncbi:MAG: membrane protein insertion efficiency factor YidD [Desulfobacteraceae bacterium 4572_88]|nr:MAG: membrane protein insertion efficiency factor YidD [Desulfobacteraceae bacterium 4572_88]